MRRLISQSLAALSLLAIVAAAGAYYFWAAFTQPGQLEKEAVVVIPKGSSVAAIGSILKDGGVIQDPLIFTLGTRLWSRGRPLQAGEYEFPIHVSPRAAMQIMIDGKSIQHQVTVAEGLTVAEIYQVLLDAPLLEGELPPPPPEGSLLPETYSYLRGENRGVLLGRMQKAMELTLEDLWSGRSADIAVQTKEQALTLASIVEKETGVASERPHVASVFHNRLRKGMKLQSDPTVIYALTMGHTKLGRPLTTDDLKFDSPYNTYVIDGLPPGPIANPGRAALEATLHPQASEDLYFVADGSGGHAFAKTLEEHNKNVAAWRKVQSQQNGN